MIRELFNSKLIVSLALLVVPSISQAQDLNGANTGWILTSTALVLFMTLPGLSLFYVPLPSFMASRVNSHKQISNHVFYVLLEWLWRAREVLGFLVFTPA